MAENTNPEANTKLVGLSEIADWQLDAVNAEVGLPALQRGYVWKPNQVETLWDSLLRGFPIGSFLVAENGTSKKDLLDGQQRATAIAMGYYNPWEKDQKPDFFSTNFKNVEKTVPVLWLDIEAQIEEMKGQYSDFVFLPRLVTQSHPWGYSKSGGTLELKRCRQAIDKFDLVAYEKSNENRYTNYNLKYVYPLEANLPIPMAFLIESIIRGNDVEDWKLHLLQSCQTHLKHIYNNILDIKEKLDKASEKIERIIKRLISTQIPIISLHGEQFDKESATVDNASTLFVRMNTKGTVLSGEELIYSLYKAAFPKSKSIVEGAGAGFIAPSRIINHISRLVITDITSNKSANQTMSISQQMNLTRFKDNIKNIQGDFYLGLEEISKREGVIIKSIFQQVKDILIGDKDYQLPFPLVVDIARGNADVLFILLYWLHKTHLTTNDILEDVLLHKKMLATITLLTWFSNDKKTAINEFAKDDSLRLGKREFWNITNFNDLSLNKLIKKLPKPGYLMDKLNAKFNENWENVIKDEIERNLFIEFIGKLFNQRGLLLFAQREYIKNKFEQLQWDVLIEDSNRPYDWDHIYPSVYNQRGTHPELRNIYNTIGNKRAWALSDNRSDGKDIPSKKFKTFEDRKNSFIVDTTNWLLWEKIRSPKIIDSDQDNAKDVCNAIYTRIGNIYKEWYDKLSVGELFK